MIQLESLTFSYPNHKPIFEDFSWLAGTGQSWAVLGTSGCGKSTLLYLLAGLLQAASGRILINGTSVTGPRPQTGLILQDYGLLPWATVRQNVALGLNLRQFYGPDGIHAPAQALPIDAEERVSYWLDRLNISQTAGQYPGQISGGQRQRAAIARTLVLEPDLLLMDEPFASLDAPARESLQSLILNLHAERPITTILVTHTIDEALFVGEKILVLHNTINRVPLILDNVYVGMVPPVSAEGYSSLAAQLRTELKGVPE